MKQRIRRKISRNFLQRFYFAAGRITLFLLLFAGIFAGAGRFLQPVWYDWNNYDTLKGFYEEPEHTIHTLFLGASVTVNAVSPMQLYEEHGICAYNLGTEQQPLLASYYWLEEVYRLHRESLETVFLDVSRLRTETDDAFYRKAIDSMHFSPIKCRAVRDYTDGSLSAVLSYLVPMFSYHSRWENLGKTDFEKFDCPVNTCLRGYNPVKDHTCFDENNENDLFVPDYHPDTQSSEKAVFLTESLYYLRKIVDFCQEQDLQLILMKTPTPQWNWANHSATEEIAEWYGLEFLDFNYGTLLDEVSMNMAVDMLDENHMNIYGARKLTSWLGDYLIEEWDASDVRRQNRYAFLEEELEQYHRLVGLYDEPDPAEYLADLVGQENYSVLISVRDEASNQLTEKQKESFSKLGLTGLSQLGFRASYLALLENGQVIFEITKEDPAAEAETSETDNLLRMDALTSEDIHISQQTEQKSAPLSVSGLLLDGAAYSAKSGGCNMGNIASCVIDGTEYAVNSRGLNIVVYDNARHKVFDTASFDTFDSSVRLSGDLEQELTSALRSGEFVEELPEQLQKLFRYNLRCEEAGMR